MGCSRIFTLKCFTGFLLCLAYADFNCNSIFLEAIFEYKILTWHLSFWLAFPHPLIQDSMKVFKAVGWGLLLKGDLCHEERMWPKIWQKVVNERGVVLLESWWPAICNFIEENDLKVSLHILICEVSLGTWLNSHPPLFGRGRIPIELVTGWRAGLVCESGKVAARPCGPSAKLPPSTGLSSLSELCADHACHRRVYVPCSSRKKAFLRIVLIWKTHLANLVPLSLLIALSLEGLSGRAPSIDFPQTMKLWNGTPEWLWVIAIWWSQQLVPLLVKKLSGSSGLVLVLDTGCAR